MEVYDLLTGGHCQLADLPGDLRYDHTMQSSQEVTGKATDMEAFLRWVSFSCKDLLFSAENHFPYSSLGTKAAQACQCKHRKT